MASMTSNRSGRTAARSFASRSSSGVPGKRSDTAYAHPWVSPRAVTAGTGSAPPTTALTTSSFAKSPPYRLTRSTMGRPAMDRAYAVDQAPAASETRPRLCDLCVRRADRRRRHGHEGPTLSRNQVACGERESGGRDLFGSARGDEFSHRLLIFSAGRISAELEGEEINEAAALSRFFERKKAVA